MGNFVLHCVPISLSILSTKTWTMPLRSNRFLLSLRRVRSPGRKKNYITKKISVNKKILRHFATFRLFVWWPPGPPPPPPGPSPPTQGGTARECSTRARLHTYIKNTLSARIPINLPSKLSRTFQFARLLPEHLRPPPPAGGGGDVLGGAQQREGEEGVGGGAGDPAGSKPGSVAAEAPLKQALKNVNLALLR